MDQSMLKMKTDMELRGFSPKTVNTYTKSVKTIAIHFNIEPEHLTTTHIREFLHHSIMVRNLSRSYINCAYSAARFYLETSQNLSWDIKYIPRVKKTSKLPVILSPAQIQQLFDSVENLKHKTMLMCCYSGGLRVSEVMNLKVSDINSSAMHIRIRSGKGGKERLTLLSNRNLLLLRRYYIAYKPTDWLFFNAKTGKQLSTRSLQIVMNEQVVKLRFPVGTSLHSLRHSFATHLIRSGVDIAVIQKLMGHSDIRTTSQYLHLTTADTLLIASPLDTLEVFHD